MRIPRSYFIVDGLTIVVIHSNDKIENLDGRPLNAKIEARLAPADPRRPALG
jgi:hypothetical protein